MSRTDRTRTETATLDADQQAFADALNDRYFGSHERDARVIDVLVRDLRCLVAATFGADSAEMKELGFAQPKRDLRAEEAKRAAAKKIENRPRPRHSR